MVVYHVVAGLRTESGCQPPPEAPPLGPNFHNQFCHGNICPVHSASRQCNHQRSCVRWEFQLKELCFRFARPRGRRPSSECGFALRQLLHRGHLEGLQSDCMRRPQRQLAATIELCDEVPPAEGRCNKCEQRRPRESVCVSERLVRRALF